MRYPRAVLFGGTGFIGRHLARILLETGVSEKVYLCDVSAPDTTRFPPSTILALEEGRVEYLRLDVREQIPDASLPQRVDLVVNLAAIHREPGHEPAEYFETNMLGAENVCAWSARVGCETVVFTSSIAPYGPSEVEKDEQSLPAPETPYGSSKLVAEKIHLAWQRENPDRRRLLIVRPGIVFGPGENGHMTMMIRALRRHCFFYVGRGGVRKAGGYVKELVHSLLWVLERLQENGDGVVVYNFTSEPAPRIEDYVDAICSAAGFSRHVPRIPYVLIFPISFLVDGVARALRIRQPFNPTRVRKLARSNRIRADYLCRVGYPFSFSLEEAMRDWRRERPADWER
jgi:nucleoside-diphosphate-sugar epimerase